MCVSESHHVPHRPTLTTWRCFYGEHRVVPVPRTVPRVSALTDAKPCLSQPRLLAHPGLSVTSPNGTIPRSRHTAPSSARWHRPTPSNATHQTPLPMSANQRPLRGSQILDIRVLGWTVCSAGSAMRHSQWIFARCKVICPAYTDVDSAPMTLGNRDCGRRRVVGWPAPDDPIKILGVFQTQCHLSVGQTDVGAGLRGLISASDALCWSYGG